MKNLALVVGSTLLAVATLSTLHTGTAHAGGFVALGVGGSASLGSDFSAYEGGGKNGRLVVGERFGAFSLETGINVYGMNLGSAGEYNEYSAQVAGKYNYPLFFGLEAYGRLGLERNWLRTNGPGSQYDGNGYFVALGLEYPLKIDKYSGSVFVDYTVHSADVSSTNRTLSLEANMLTFGVSFNIPWH